MIIQVQTCNKLVRGRLGHYHRGLVLSTSGEYFYVVSREPAISAGSMINIRQITKLQANELLKRPRLRYNHLPYLVD